MSVTRASSLPKRSLTPSSSDCWMRKTDDTSSSCCVISSTIVSSSVDRMLERIRGAASTME